jgi:hypothetical protein
MNEDRFVVKSKTSAGVWAVDHDALSISRIHGFKRNSMKTETLLCITDSDSPLHAKRR